MQCPDGDLSFYFHIYLLIPAVFSFSPGLPKLRSQELHHGGLHMQEISQLPYLEAIVPFLPLTHSPNQYILWRMLHIYKFQYLGSVSPVFQNLGTDGIRVKGCHALFYQAVEGCFPSAR